MRLEGRNLREIIRDQVVISSKAYRRVEMAKTLAALATIRALDPAVSDETERPGSQSLGRHRAGYQVGYEIGKCSIHALNLIRPDKDLTM